MSHYDYDFIVIGSGFGGSVSAMRLTQKGYKVAVIEAGKRFRNQDFPKTNWNLRKYFWFPTIFFYGIQRINILRHTLILSGAGVGGGSLVYANTLYVPLEEFFEHPKVKVLGGYEELLPYYEIAKKMLGVVETPKTFRGDEILKKTAEEMGFGQTFRPTPVGVYFGKVDDPQDPYFEGEGPKRNGCIFCGNCMVGCRHNAKNSLDKNYLYFAEKLGAKVIPETKVVGIYPLSPDGSEGYEIRTITTTNLFGYPKRVFRTKGVVLSAGVLGTLKLLFTMKQKKIMPNISEKLGYYVRTNSESIIGVTSKRKDVDFSEGVAISSSVFPDKNTHIEIVRYGKNSDVMNIMGAPALIDGGGKIPRQLRFLMAFLRHPIRSVRLLLPFGFAQRSIILLVMQTLDNYLKIVHKREFYFPFKKILTSELDEGEPPPTYIPIANEFARKLSKHINGIPRSSINEVLFDIPMTAHILGGACIGRTPDDGVIDEKNRLFHYQNFYVCDGSMIPANLGVNPSLSIVAFTERAMSFIPPKNDQMHIFEFEKKWGIEALLLRMK
ncbi:MAG: GMC family oxidoreductase [Leptospiraceae bacterium]|nr:GMC family oxidoreductase [Leptospiraceae bacterium]MDW7975264.1 GMC family oxidoreductase [Leptospiraceae bacterium]